MPLTLLVGPANAGKVAGLLDRYVAALDRDPFLVVPNRAEVERVERDLLVRGAGAARRLDRDVRRPVPSRSGTAGRTAAPALLSPAQRALVVARVISRTPLAAHRLPRPVSAASQRRLADALGELEAALVEPGRRRRRPRRALSRPTGGDRAPRRRRPPGPAAAGGGARRVRPRSMGHDPRPRLRLRGHERRPVAPARGARGAHRGLRLAAVRAGSSRVRGAGAHGERPRCSRGPPYRGAPAAGVVRVAGSGAPRAGAVHGCRRRAASRSRARVRFLEAAGSRAALELVGDGDPRPAARRVSRRRRSRSSCPSVESRLASARDSVRRAWRAVRVRRASCVSGAPPSAVRCSASAVSPGSRAAGADLYSLPSLAVLGHRRASASTSSRGGCAGGPCRPGPSRGGDAEAARSPIPALDRLREPAVAARGRARGRAGDAAGGVGARAAPGSRTPPASTSGPRRRPSASSTSWRRWLEPSDAATGGAGEDARASVTVVAAPARVRAACAVLDLLRARTRRFGVVFVLGLEEGVLPRRAVDSPFLPDEQRAPPRGCGHRQAAACARTRSARDRYLFYTACTRPWERLYLVREAATDDGRPLEPSPFWEEVRRASRAADVERWTRRRPLSALSWELHRAPTERERLRAVGGARGRGARPRRARSPRPGAGSARSSGRSAPSQRPTRLANPAVLRVLREQTRFSVDRARDSSATARRCGSSSG